MSLTYKDIKIEGKVKISPSSLYDYYDNPSKWYSRNVKGIKEMPNDSMIIGSLLHGRLERYYDNLGVDTDEEAGYLESFSSNSGVNDWEILDVLEGTWKYLLNTWLPTTTRPTSQEQSIVFEPKSNSDVFVAGSYDYRRGNTIGDYKTCSLLPKKIKTHHKIQAYVYAFVLRANNQHIDTIEIVYIQKYLKGKISEKTKKIIGSKKPDVVVLSEPIDEEFMNHIIQDMKNLGVIITLCKENEDLVSLFFRTNLLSHFN
jgi:hypothetical protein